MKWLKKLFGKTQQDEYDNALKEGEKVFGKTKKEADKTKLTIEDFDKSKKKKSKPITYTL